MFIEAGDTHTYVITFRFIEISLQQNYNQGKTFTGEIRINESKQIVTLKGSLLDSSNNPIQNATIEIHSILRTGTTDSEGNFSISDVESGRHNIVVKDSSNNEIANDTISLVSYRNFSFSNKTLYLDSSKKNIKVDIKVNNSEIENITLHIDKLIDVMLENNPPVSDENIDFSYDSEGRRYSGTNINSDKTTADPTKVTNGLYYTSDLTKTQDGSRIYYYRGNVNNTIIFGGYCWKIMHTNEDESIRIIYSGVPVDGVCPSGSSVPGSGSLMNNALYNEINYIGSNNTYISGIKDSLDAWYSGSALSQYDRSCFTDIINGDTPVYCNYTTLESKLINYSYLITNSVFCNDRTETFHGDPMIQDTSTGYAGFTRLMSMNSFSSGNLFQKAVSPQFKCNNINSDGFTLAGSGIGNGKLTYPVGLITGDEMTYAGMPYTSKRVTSNYLSYAAISTITPLFCLRGTSQCSVFSSFGSLSGNGAYLYPVISLKKSATVINGEGTNNKPYIIE